MPGADRSLDRARGMGAKPSPAGTVWGRAINAMPPSRTSVTRRPFLPSPRCPAPGHPFLGSAGPGTVLDPRTSGK